MGDYPGCAVSRARAEGVAVWTAALDKGYDSKPVYVACQGLAVRPIIPLKKNAKEQDGCLVPECRHGLWGTRRW